MYGAYGRFMLCDTYGAGQKGKLVVCIGDLSNHGGAVLSHNQDGTLTAKDELVAVEDPEHLLLQHRCPIENHGQFDGIGWVTPIIAVTVKSFHNGKLILTELAFADAPCGARLAPPNRTVYVE